MCFLCLKAPDENLWDDSKALYICTLFKNLLPFINLIMFKTIVVKTYTCWIAYTNSYDYIDYSLFIQKQNKQKKKRNLYLTSEQLVSFIANI